MRFIGECNPSKRGCLLCADVKIIKCNINGRMENRRCCLHAECPYHELDDFKTYSDYDKYAKKIGRNLLEEWLKKVFILSEKYIDCQKST